jgi:excisionase family DNA binding protein
MANKNAEKNITESHKGPCHPTPSLPCSVSAPGVPLSDPQRLLTADEVAALFRVHVKTVYLAARTGKLPCRRIGGAVRFVWAEVDEALAKEATEYVESRRA